MNRRLKSCSATTPTTSPSVLDVQNHNFSALIDDRLTSLPDELLIQILSLLPTKDAATTSILSRKLRRLFPYITSLDFDASLINQCLEHPYAIQRYPTFVKFVDTVLQAYKSKYLTRFRLQVVSRGIDNVYFSGCCSNHLKKSCFPDLKVARVDAWFSFPLTFCGLWELDLSILLRNPRDAQLPPAIFTCESLQVLKLELNVGIDEVITMPSYRLPSLKLLDFRSIRSDDGFLTRLVSSCPVLEDLTYEVFITHVHHTTVFSTSLRRLCLLMQNDDPACLSNNTGIVHIDTPNLEYLEYSDNVPFKYSIPIMHRLVEAKLHIIELLPFSDFEVSFQHILCLVRSCSLAPHISLLGFMLREFDYAGEKVVKDQLPMFPNLKRLELQRGAGDFYWDRLMLPFLNCSPALETLVFTEGLTEYYEDGDGWFDGKRLELEREFFRTDHAIPSCCRSFLKKIVIHDYLGLEREVEMIQFLLRHTLVLEELVVCRSQELVLCQSQKSMPDLISVENTLNNLPKASVTCSIQVS